MAYGFVIFRKIILYQRIKWISGYFFMSQTHISYVAEKIQALRFRSET